MSDYNSYDTQIFDDRDLTWISNRVKKVRENKR